MNLFVVLSHSRGTSIKTRIETAMPSYKKFFQKIQEAHPLKQGLKLQYMLTILQVILIQEAHPLKQGLKLKKYELIS